MITTAMAAAMTATRWRNGDATATVMDSDGRCNGNTMIEKKLGERILAWNCRDFDVAGNIRDKLRNKYLVEIDKNKEWMMVAPRGGRRSKDDNREGDDSNIVSREEWEEGGDKDGDASSSIDFVNDGGGTKDEDEEAENVTVTMEDDNSNSDGALSSSSSDVSDEHASLTTMTIPNCPRAKGEASGG